MTNQTLLITGASGFVGRFLWPVALSKGFDIHVASRQCAEWSPALKCFQIGSLDGTTDWRAALQGRSCVIHLAGRAHVMHEQLADPLSEYRRVNVAASLNLARQAVQQGVKRFIYVSSVKVNGEATDRGQPFSADSQPAPQDAYGISKWETEQALQALALESGLELVIVRPTLIYGPGVKANFATLIRLLKRRLPLPFATITDNRRSLVGLDNLTDFLLLCVTHPAAANQTFLVSDGEDLSTAQLLSRLGSAIGYPARLFPVPQRFLKWGAKLSGKSEKAQRLLGNLQVDIQKNRERLNWVPPVSVNQGFRRLGAHLSD